jgi:hypothetical protein
MDSSYAVFLTESHWLCQGYNRQGNPREFKLFSLVLFGFSWICLAGFRLEVVLPPFGIGFDPAQGKAGFPGANGALI